MADQVEASEQVQDGEEEPRKGGKLASLLLLVVGLAAGSGAGLFFVGPLVAGDGAESTEEVADDGHGAPADDGHGAPEDDGHGGDISEDGVDPLIHTLTNVIVNPAGSGGSRFLLLDVALRLSNEAAVTELAGRDPQVRDAIVHLLGAKTITELAEISGRDLIKSEMQELISGILGSGRVTAIFFPRYVIQ